MKQRSQRISLEFQYDTLVDRHNICNRVDEIKTIGMMVNRGQRVVLYAPRRYGKTSLMHNVIAKDFLRKSKNAFIVMVDFMDVTDLSSIERRLAQSISQSFRTHAPVKDFLKSIVRYFANIALTIDFDPISGLPSASLKGSVGGELATIDGFFQALKKISEDRPLLLILDEFQDIQNIEGAEGYLRKNIQTLSKVPMIISGSKRRLLTKMFASAKAPFFGFGDEVALGPISPTEWLLYFNARFQTANKSIDIDLMTDISQRVNHVPNAICEIGFWLWHDQSLHGKITSQALWVSLDRMIHCKEQGFRYQIAPFTQNEKTILSAIAKFGYVLQPTSKMILKEVKSNASSVLKTLAKLERLGVIEWELDLGYRLSDPLLSLFMAGDRK